MLLHQPSDIRTINRLRVLNLIRSQKGLSRADISKTLALNKPSCSEIVKELIDEGLVAEGEKSQTESGRRPTPLMLAKGERLVVGISIGFRLLSIAISDLEGNVLGYKQIPTPHDPSPKELCVLILKNFLHMYRGDGKKLAGCAIGVNARISPDGSSIEELSPWGWKDVPLASPFATHMGCPCILVDETEAMVCAQRMLAKDNPDSFLYLNWGEVIGATLVLGKEEIKSNLGHVRVENEGSCTCGGTGCLETVSAGWAIEKRFGETPLRTLSQQRPEGLGKVLEAATFALGMEIAQALAITGQKRVLLGGTIPTLFPELGPMLTQAVDRFLPPFMGKAELIRSPLGDKARQMGPVAVALERFVFRQSLLASLGIEKNRYSLERE